MKKVALLFLIFPLLQLACDKENRSCGAAKHFNITGLELTPSITDENYFNITIKDLDSARFEKFYFNGQLQAEYYGINFKTSFSLFPKAYADDACPPPGWNGSEEKLAGFYLISSGKYNANIQPGDTLKDNYRINNLTPEEYYNQNSQKIRFQEINITLTEKPDPKEFQSFKLIYKLTNGETYEITTPRFKLY